MAVTTESASTRARAAARVLATLGRGAKDAALEGMQNIRRIYDHAEEHAEEVNLYIIGEGEPETTSAEGSEAR